MSRRMLIAVIAALALLSLPPALSMAQTRTLAVGETVAGTFAEGADPVAYSIEVPDDSFLFGEVDQISVDVVVRILDPEGEQVAQFDGPARGPERFVRRIEEGGTYQIEVSPFEGAAGDYAIVIHRLEPLETDPAKLTDQLMSPYTGDDTPGGAVQVWRDGETLFSKAYGMADLTWGIPFRTDTRTNIGSTSKQFTAFSVMLLVDRGELALDDDIRDYIPELPEFDQTITVRHLLTHTSGLREFINLVLMEGRQVGHGDWVGRDEVIEIVQRQPALQNEPGTEFNYNNTAFALAAVIVERISGQDFDEFARENIFEPLGMDRTMVRATRERIVPESSEGYTPGSDGYLELGDLGGAVGAGGIYSTVEDLQTWVENYADPKVGNADIVQQMTTAFVLPDDEDPEHGYGLGLFIDEQRGLQRVQHGGADIAHRSMLAYYPEINAGITVQSNNAAFASNVAFELAEAFFADAFEPEEEETEDTGEFDPASFDPEAFDEFAGRYELDAVPGFILTFSREGDTYYTQATGQQQVEIEPVSPTRFRLLQVDAEVEFLRDDEGAIEGLTLFQNGENHATRLDGDAEPAWAPTTDDLMEFQGRYYSEELETFYTIVLPEPEADEDESMEADDAVDSAEAMEGSDDTEDDEEPTLRLTVRQRRMDDFTLTSGERDTFSGGGFNFSFERDRNGQIIGFYLANGRTRDVRFERIGEP